MDKKIKAAILGYGRNGSTMHADAIEKNSAFDLTAVCDIDENARNKAHVRFNCRVYENYREMIEKEGLDLVVIVTRSSQHCEMTCDCLAAGKNVLVTKPWAVNSIEAEKMIAAAKDNGKLLLPWLPARWGADLVRLREIIKSGIIGKVFQVRRSEFIFAVRHDWQTLKEFGGGYLLNWGSHLIDQPVQLLGEPVKSVYGNMKQVINPGDVEDIFYAVMKTADDTIIVSEFNIGLGGLPNWIIQGDRGTILARGVDIEIHTAVLPEKTDSSAYGISAKISTEAERISGDRYGDTDFIYAHIADAFLGNTQYSVSTDSALNLTRILDAVRKSNDTGHVVYL